MEDPLARPAVDHPDRLAEAHLAHPAAVLPAHPAAVLPAHLGADHLAHAAADHPIRLEVPDVGFRAR